jgi:hypothetical protein
MCSFQDPHQNSGSEASGNDTGSKSDAKTKHRRFCASFSDYIFFDWFSYIFDAENKNCGSASNIEPSRTCNSLECSKESSKLENGSSSFFPNEESSIRHSLSLGEGTVI